MIIQKTFFPWIFLIFAFQLIYSKAPIAEQFRQVGYLEMCDNNHGTATFDTLYAHFDEVFRFYLDCKSNH